LSGWGLEGRKGKLLNLNLLLQREEIKGVAAVLSLFGDSWKLELFSILICHLQFPQQLVSPLPPNADRSDIDALVPMLLKNSQYRGVYKKGKGKLYFCE
jgi:hypothetical protein